MSKRKLHTTNFTKVSIEVRTWICSLTCKRSCLSWGEPSPYTKREQKETAQRGSQQKITGQIPPMSPRQLCKMAQTLGKTMYVQALPPRQSPRPLLPLQPLRPFLQCQPCGLSCFASLLRSFLAVPEITTNPELNNYPPGSIPDVTDEPKMFNIQNVRSEVPTDSSKPSTKEFSRYVDGKNM